jgi:hypothetical protein
MKYTTGLNVDTEEFNIKETCGKGGLYFCRFRDFPKWVTNDSVKLWMVTCPHDAYVVDMGDKLKAHELILSHPQMIFSDPYLVEKLCTYDANNAQFINKEILTDELKTILVRNNPYCLLHFEQTHKLQLEALKNYDIESHGGDIWRYFTNPSDEVKQYAARRFHQAHDFFFPDEALETQKDDDDENFRSTYGMCFKVVVFGIVGAFFSRVAFDIMKRHSH